MLYRGFRDFRTEDNGLAADLRRQNQVIEEGFGNAERELAQRGRVVKTTDATYQAQHGEFVLAGYNQAATILLPLSTPDTALRTVEIVCVANSLTIVPQPGQTVAGAASYSIGFAGIGKTLKDDGLGGFWVMDG